MHNPFDLEQDLPTPITQHGEQIPMFLWGASRRPLADGRDALFETIPMSAKNGFHILGLPLPGEKFFHIPWPRPGEDYDFSEMDALLERCVEIDPEVSFIPRIWVDPPKWWRDEHPDDLVKWENGQTENWVSVASEAWRSEAVVHLRATIEHIEQRWGSRTLGYHVGGQNSWEWFYPMCDGPQWGLMCYEKVFRDGWAAWLGDRYGTIAALNAAWGTSLPDFEAITAPRPEELWSSSLGVFRDPVAERRVIDFTRYQNHAMTEAVLLIAQATKQAAGKEKINYVFYGYTLEHCGFHPHGGSYCGHRCTRQAMDDENIDVFCAPMPYNDRAPAGALSVMIPTGSLKIRNKGLYIEDDTRTHLSREDSGFCRVDNAQELAWTHTRNTALGIIHRAHMQYMDHVLCSPPPNRFGWLMEESIWQHLARLRTAYSQVVERNEPWRPEVAVLVDDECLMSLAYGTTLTRPLVYDMRKTLHRAGFTPEFYLQSDFVDGLVPPAKMYIFLNAFCLDAAERKTVRDRLADSGATAMWFYAPGFLDPGGASTDAMGELTGFSFERLAGPRDTLIRVAPEAWPDGLDGEFGDPAEIDPAFAVRDAAGLTVRGRYVTGGQIALAQRETDGLRSIFCGGIAFRPDLLAALAREAGVHLYAAAGDVIHTDGTILSFTATSAGDKTLTLADPAVVINALTGEARPAGSVHPLPAMAAGETRLFLIQPQ